MQRGGNALFIRLRLECFLDIRYPSLCVDLRDRIFYVLLNLRRERRVVRALLQVLSLHFLDSSCDHLQLAADIAGLRELRGVGCDDVKHLV